MKLNLDTGTASNSIRNYGIGQITVNETEYRCDFIVMPESIIPDWHSAPVADLTADHFEPLFNQDREIVLLGTGRDQRFPNPRLIAELGRQGIGLEVMDTAAACRTYNVLMSEDRRVAAALMMIEGD